MGRKVLYLVIEGRTPYNASHHENSLNLEQETHDPPVLSGPTKHNRLR